MPTVTAYAVQNLSKIIPDYYLRKSFAKSTFFPNAYLDIKPTMKPTHRNNCAFDLGLHVLGSRADNIELVSKSLVISYKTKEICYFCVSTGYKSYKKLPY
jgi:hypothetical protein